MKKYFKTIIGAVFATLLFSAITVHAVTVFNSNQLGNSPAKGKLLVASSTVGPSTWLATSTDGYVLVQSSTAPYGVAWVAQSVSGGSVSTSSPITAGYFPYWANTTGGLNGTSTLFYDTATGYLGIGTIYPSSTLHIVGTSTFTGNVEVATLKVGTLSGLLKGTSGVVSAITDSSSNWDTAYTDRLKWDGGATGLTAATGRTSLELGTIATFASTDYRTSSTATVSSVNSITGAVVIASAGKASVSSSSQTITVSASSSYPLQWIIENPTGTEDDYIFTAKTTSTIDQVFAVNKSTGDTVTFNLVASSSRTSATSTSNSLFASYTAITATTTASCYASATSSLCGTGVFGTNASTTLSPGQTLRFITTAASSSQFGLTIWITEN